jgi:chorismate synthase
MNTFGRLFRVQILGESHGEGAGVLLDGVPAGIPLSVADFETDIARRKPGAKGTTPRKEADMPELKTGVFNGFTTGAPLLIWFSNENTRSSDYDWVKTQPRPGHVDWVAMQKFHGFSDHRGGGHFSGRLTVCLVAAGVVAKKMLEGIKIQSTILEVGGEADVEQGLEKAIAMKDSIGGIVECRATGIPAGWGEPFWDSIESAIAHAAFAIPAVKGIEFGAGFRAARMMGTEHNDALMNATGQTVTNHAGGVVGGISNGNELVFRVAVKPTASTPKPQQSFNLETNAIETFSVKGRHDLCIALRVPVVLESIAAIALADFKLLAAAF